MTKTLIILNPHAAGGRAGNIWTQIEPILWDKLGELVIAVTQNPEEVAIHLDKAYASGLTRVISIGGDGTNHALINALADLNEQNPDGPPMVYGMLPVGTGRDWARSVGIPFNIEDAAEWIANAQPQAIDIGQFTFETPQGGREKRHFLNIASSGISGYVSDKVNRVAKRRPWTFLKATIETLIRHPPERLQISLDGEEWYDGSAYLVAVANGTTFGRGMRVAPHAEVDDGLFDVILVEGMARARAILALRRIYDASHLQHPAVHFRQAKEVRVQRSGGLISTELDGEATLGQDLAFRVRPGLLHLLTHP